MIKLPFKVPLNVSKKRASLLVAVRVFVVRLVPTRSVTISWITRSKLTTAFHDNFFKSTFSRRWESSL